MNKIKALIVDDEKLARAAVRSLLEKDSDVVVVGEAVDGIEARQLVALLKPELLFLDVQMPGQDGLALLGGIPPAERPQIIFTTAFDQHALRAFEFHAVDFLVKPFSDARFREALDRAKSRLRGCDIQEATRAVNFLMGHLAKAKADLRQALPDPSAGRLVVKIDGEVHFIEQGDIRWIEGQKDFVRIHTGAGRLLARATLQSLLAKLDASRFIRIHKSTIVNLTYVRRLRPLFTRSLGVELADGTVRSVGRGYRATLEASIN